MGDTIHVKSGELGNRAEMPKLSYDKEKGSEIAYRTDEEALYIGTEQGNKRLCGAKDKADIIAQIDALSNRIEEITARLVALETPTE